MRPIPLVILALLALTLPAFAGCLGEEAVDPAVDDGEIAGSAEDAGARAGEAPVAPKQAYQVSTEEPGENAPKQATAYPVPLATNPARPPVVLDLSGTYRPQDCRGLNFGSLESTLREVSNHRRWHDLSEHLQVGDVYAYEITMTYENTQDSWAEIHPLLALGNTIMEHDDASDGPGTVAITWTGQGYRVSAEDPAFLIVRCWYGAMTRDIPYTLTVKLSFAESAIPAETPFRVPVPEGATRMFIRGVPIDAEKGVLSHFRIFGPDDAMLCECVLSSDKITTSFPVDGAGDYVLLVDHTDNGFVSLAFDAPSVDPITPMEVQWFQQVVFSHDGGPVDEIIEFDLATVPLFMNAWPVARDRQGGVGQATSLVLENTRGEVLRMGWAGHITMEHPGEGTMWLGLPSVTGGWFDEVDHHAFAPGKHTGRVKADAFRGEILLFTRQYVR